VSGPKKIDTECRGMEEAWTTSSSENEVKWMDVHLGVGLSNSNGHEEEIDKKGHMMEIIERLLKYAQNNQADNIKLLKSKDRQG
jgi:hypothetical protein